MLKRRLRKNSFERYKKRNEIGDNYYRNIDDIVEVLKRAKEDQINVNLLIGAGCSITAGIPDANGFIEEIRKRFSLDYEKAEKKDYATCMSKIPPFYRKQLIMDFVNNSKVNWAHIAVAQLLKYGYINRILTTNFDNLLLRACSMVGEYPAVYDLAYSNKFRTDMLFDKSILHLHGQHTGFILCNTRTEVEEQAKYLNDIFTELNQKSVWLIAGYSGRNDAIFELLNKRDIFDYRLYWVGYKEQPPTEIQAQLLGEKKYGYFIKGYDADDFFVILTRRLGCFPPDFIRKPFSNLNLSLEKIAPYSLPAEEVLITNDLKQETGRLIKEAIQLIENNREIMADHYITIGLDEEVLSLLEKCDNIEREKIVNNIRDKTAESGKNEIQKYERQLKDNPRNVDTILKLANRLQFVSLLDELNAKKYRLKACEMYQTALSIEPDNFDILYSLGKCFHNMSPLYKEDNEGAEYCDWQQKACSIFYQAHEQRPKNANVLFYWGLSLYNLASKQTEEVAYNLYEEALVKLKEANNIDPKNKNILLILSDLLIIMADLRMSPKRTRVKEIPNTLSMIRSACYHLINAHKIAPKDNEIFNLFGKILSKLKFYTGIPQEQKDSISSLLYDICDAFASTFENNKDSKDILYFWSSTLYFLVDFHENEFLKIESCYSEACKKLELAFKIEPNDVDIIVLWSAILSDWAYCNKVNRKKAITLFRESCDKVSKFKEFCDKVTNPVQALDSVLEVWGNSICKFVDFCNYAEIQENRQYYNDYISYIQRVLVEKKNIFARKKLLSALNDLAYNLILSNVFEESYQVLESILKYDPNNIFFNATMGFWYLRNIMLPDEVSLQKGNELYKKAYEFAKISKSKIVDGILQKYQFELAYFFVERKKDVDSAKEPCLLAYEIGTLELYSAQMDDIVALMKKVSPPPKDSSLGEEEVAVVMDEYNNYE